MTEEEKDATYNKTVWQLNISALDFAKMSRRLFDTTVYLNNIMQFDTFNHPKRLACLHALSKVQDASFHLGCLIGNLSDAAIRMNETNIKEGDITK